MRLVVWVLVNAAALAVAAWLLDGIAVGGATTTEQALTLLGVAVVFGLVDTVVGTVVKLLSLPFIILTLGLLLLVINAALLLLTGWIADELGLAFTVDGFWPALLGALVVSVVKALLHAVLDD